MRTTTARICTTLTRKTLISMELVTSVTTALWSTTLTRYVNVSLKRASEYRRCFQTIIQSTEIYELFSSVAKLFAKKNTQRVVGVFTKLCMGGVNPLHLEAKATQ